VYRCFIEGLCGLRGVREGLRIEPKMPSSWQGMHITREFRGATFEVEIGRGDVDVIEVQLDGAKMKGNVIRAVEKGRRYSVKVEIPRANMSNKNAMNGHKLNGSMSNRDTTDKPEQRNSSF
jgi:cellobionic acid phosphorylase